MTSNLELHTNIKMNIHNTKYSHNHKEKLLDYMVSPQYHQIELKKIV